MWPRRKFLAPEAILPLGLEILKMGVKEMLWNPWKLADLEKKLMHDEHWIDNATADGSPWSDEIPHGDDLDEQSAPS